MSQPLIEEGDWVEKYTGEARYVGVVVSKYPTLLGHLRYVVEVWPQHFQMICTDKMLRKCGAYDWND